MKKMKREITSDEIDEALGITDYINTNKKIKNVVVPSKNKVKKRYNKTIDKCCEKCKFYNKVSTNFGECNNPENKYSLSSSILADFVCNYFKKKEK